MILVYSPVELKQLACRQHEERFTVNLSEITVSLIRMISAGIHQTEVIDSN